MTLKERRVALFLSLSLRSKELIDKSLLAALEEISELLYPYFVLKYWLLDEIVSKVQSQFLIARFLFFENLRVRVFLLVGGRCSIFSA